MRNFDSKTSISINFLTSEIFGWSEISEWSKISMPAIIFDDPMREFYDLQTLCNETEF